MRNSDMAVIYTSDSTTMTKLDKKVKSVNSEWKLKEVHRLQDTEEIIGKTYTCPKSLISFRTARKHCSSQNCVLILVRLVVTQITEYITLSRCYLSS